MAQLKSTDIFGTVKVHSQAQSIGTESGSLVVAGGVGIGKSLFIGESLDINGTINGLTLTEATTGFTIEGGTTSKTLTVLENATISHSTHALTSDNQTIASGSGMNFTSGSGDVTIALGTPSTITTSTVNIVTVDSHTHALTLPATMPPSDHSHTANNITDFDTGVNNNTSVTFNTDHRELTTGNPHNVSKADVGLSNVPNLDFRDASNITTGTLPSSVLPPIAITSSHVVASEVAQLALTVQEGDIAIRTDENKSYVHNSGTAGTMADWDELRTPTDSVLSVNGEAGAVTLTTGDLNEDTDHKYVTDTQKIVIGNTSGINTGDQSSSDFTHNDLNGYESNEHIDHSSVSIRGGNGLTGEGTLESDITISLGTPSDITTTSDNTVTENSHTHKLDLIDSNSNLAIATQIFDGSYNIGIGSNVLSNIVLEGSYNIGIGGSSLYSNTTGTENTVIGYSSLYDNTTGDQNTAIGYYSLYDNTTGNQNTAIGYYSGRYTDGLVITNKTSSNSVYLGANTKAKFDGDTNEIVIGYNTAGNGSNTVTIGNEYITDNYFTGTVNASTLNADAINATSLRALKDDIKSFENNAIDLLKSVDIVSYTYKSDPEKSYHVGFIADDTDPILSGEKQNHMDMGNSIGVLIKAMQELSERVSALEKVYNK